MNNKPLERSEYIGMKVTPQEKKDIYAAAAAAGLSVTAYLVGLGVGTLVSDLRKKNNQI